jgi:hypothetical protein
VVLVFFDKYDYTTLRSASVVFIDNVRAGTFPRAHSVFKGMNIVAIPLLFNYVDRSWAMGVQKKIVSCFESQQCAPIFFL